MAQTSGHPSAPKLCDCVTKLFLTKSVLLNRSKKRNTASDLGSHQYSELEDRKVFASLFPTYVNGVFTLGDDTGASPYALEDTFNLETNPGATRTIYLDFDGHRSVNNDWNHDIDFDAYDRDGDPNSFSDAELIEIQLQFQNIAEDFIPFDVNVTTADPGLAALTRTSSSDQTYGIRNVFSQAEDGFGGFGGVAYLGSFDDAIDNPSFTFNKGVNNGAQTASHEVGHALGLLHDGLGNAEYHSRVGSGGISWGPLLGAPFFANVTQWSNGDYANATNTQDDLQIITNSRNGINYRTDDVGNTFSSATDLTADDGQTIFEWGIIERNTDLDFFRFETGGRVRFNIEAFEGNPNLDIDAKLYDASGNIVATSNPDRSVDASFNLDLDPGTYYISVDGGGSEYASDYGSLGFYTIEGRITEAITTPPIGEAGTVAGVNHEWQTIRLEQTYENPVVVFSPAQRSGGSPVNVRVANVTGSSFQVKVDEWEYLDGAHARETLSYVVLEAGEHTLADGTKIVAGNQSVTHRWGQVDFGSSSFDDTPLVFSQIASDREATAATTRFRNIDANGFEVLIQEEQGAASRTHLAERISWIAIEEVGVGTLDTGAEFEASQTGLTVDHRLHNNTFDAAFDASPVFLASIQSFSGGDVSTVRAWEVTDDGFGVNIEEERSGDFEIAHNNESVGYFALPEGIIRGQTTPTEFTVTSSNPTSGEAYPELTEYSAGSNTEEAWAAYQLTTTWAEGALASAHAEGDEHDHSDHNHCNDNHDYCHDNNGDNEDDDDDVDVNDAQDRNDGQDNCDCGCEANCSCHRSEVDGNDAPDEIDIVQQINFYAASEDTYEFDFSKNREGTLITSGDSIDSLADSDGAIAQAADDVFADLFTGVDSDSEPEELVTFGE